MMRWRRIGFWSLLTVLGIFVLALSWLWTADLGILKPQIERWASETTGRDLTIGDLSIDFGGRTIIVARDVKFANAEWADTDEMLTLGRAEIHIDLRSVFSGPPVIEEIDVSDVAVRLTVSPDGDANWQLDLPPSESIDPPQEEDVGAPVLVREALLQNLELEYVSPERDLPLQLTVALAAQQLRDDNYLDFRLRGAISGRQVSLDGEAGSWDALISGQDIGFDAYGMLDTLSVSVAGYIDNVAEPRQPTFAFEATGPDIDDLFTMLGLSDEGSGDISISGELSRPADELMQLLLTGNMGQTVVEARALFPNLGDLSMIDGEVRASGPDLGRILTLAGLHGISQAPFQLVADIERSGPEVNISKAEMLVGDTRFLMSARLPQFPAVDDGSLTLNLNGPDLARLRRITGLPGAATGPFAVEVGLSVDADGRELFDFNLETSLGKASATGEILGGETYLGTTAQVDVEIFDVAATARAWQLDVGALPAEALTASGQVEYVAEGIRTISPVTASLGELGLSAQGTVALAAAAAGSNILFEASGPRLRTVTDPFSDSRFIPPDAFAVDGRMLIEDGAIRFSDLTGQLGNAAMIGDARIVFAPRIAGSTIEFEVSGDTFEETLAHLPTLRVKPGPFKVSGGLRFDADALHLDAVSLERPISRLQADISIGLPAERQWMKVRMSGNGDDARGLLSSVPGFQPAAVPFSIELSGERDGNTVQVEQFSFTLADASLGARGTLDFGDRIDSTRFRLNLDVPNLARLGKVGDREFNEQLFQFDGRIDGRPGELRIDEARLAVANSSATGSFLYRVGERPFIEIDVESDRLAFSPLFVDNETEELASPEPPDDGRVIPDVDIPFEALRRLDARLRFRVAELERRNLYLRNVVLDASLDDGALVLSDLSLHARSGFLRGKATVDAADGEGDIGLQLIAEKLAFGLGTVNADLAMTGNANINIDTRGNSLRTLASNLSGIAMLDTTGGDVPNNRMMQFLYGDMVDEIISTINPFMKSDPVTNFDCIVFPFRLQQGKLEAAPAALLRTDKLNLTLRPEINFGTERIDITVRSTPRRILSISAAELVNPYVKIIGTMASPALAVDETGVLITGGAAVATGGISVLAKAAWDRLSRSGDPCATAREESIKALGAEFPDIEPLEHLEPMPLTPPGGG